VLDALGTAAALLALNKCGVVVRAADVPTFPGQVMTVRHAAFVGDARIVSPTAPLPSVRNVFTSANGPEISVMLAVAPAVRLFGLPVV
jgi:hypothetical protein